MGLRVSDVVRGVCPAPKSNHSEEAITARYSHGGPGWNEQLRRAVTSLETAYPTALSYGLSYESARALVADAVNAQNAAKNLGKGWWSQRDLNPCLSLERAKQVT